MEIKLEITLKDGDTIEDLLPQLIEKLTLKPVSHPVVTQNAETEEKRVETCDASEEAQKDDKDF